MEMKNKVVVITGGAGGIGQAIAKALLFEDPKIIVLADISFENFDFKNDKVINKECNVSDQSDLNNLINEVNKKFGLIDIFFSNAGVLSLGDEQSSNEDWDKNWNLHVMSHVFASKKLIPDMLKRGSGYFVNTASAAGLLSHIDSVTYSTTKHAAIGFAEWLAITYGKRGIGVSIL